MSTKRIKGKLPEDYFCPFSRNFTVRLQHCYQEEDFRDIVVLLHLNTQDLTLATLTAYPSSHVTMCLLKFLFYYNCEHTLRIMDVCQPFAANVSAQLYFPYEDNVFKAPEYHIGSARLPPVSLCDVCLKIETLSRFCQVGSLVPNLVDIETKQNPSFFYTYTKLFNNGTAVRSFYENKQNQRSPFYFPSVITLAKSDYHDALNYAKFDVADNTYFRGDDGTETQKNNIITCSEEDSFTLLKIKNCGSPSCKPVMLSGPAKHNCYFLLVDNGKCGYLQIKQFGFVQPLATVHLYNVKPNILSLSYPLIVHWSLNGRTCVLLSSKTFTRCCIVNFATSRLSVLSKDSLNLRFVRRLQNNKRPGSLSPTSTKKICADSSDSDSDNSDSDSDSDSDN